MSEELTERLDGDNSFEARVLRELATLNSRMTSLDSHMASLDDRMASLDSRVTALEEKVDARMQETRPIWEAVLSRLDVIDSKLNVPALDLLETRAETELLKRRQPPAA